MGLALGRGSRKRGGWRGGRGRAYRAWRRLARSGPFLQVSWEPRECFEPRNLTVDLCGDTFAILSWNPAPAAEKYEYELSSKDTIYTAELDTMIGNLVLSDLERNTKYVLRMRTICSMPTKWMEAQFTTLNSVPKLPYQCGFEDGDENAGKPDKSSLFVQYAGKYPYAGIDLR